MQKSSFNFIYGSLLYVYIVLAGKIEREAFTVETSLSKLISFLIFIIALECILSSFAMIEMFFLGWNTVWTCIYLDMKESISVLIEI